MHPDVDYRAALARGTHDQLPNAERVLQIPLDVGLTSSLAG